MPAQDTEPAIAADSSTFLSHLGAFLRAEGVRRWVDSERGGVGACSEVDLYFMRRTERCGSCQTCAREDHKAANPHLYEEGPPQFEVPCGPWGGHLGNEGEQDEDLMQVLQEVGAVGKLGTSDVLFTSRYPEGCDARVYGGHLQTTARRREESQPSDAALPLVSGLSLPKFEMPGPNFLGLTAAPDLPPPCEDGAPQSQSGGKGLSSSGPSPQPEPWGRQPSIWFPFLWTEKTARQDKHDVDGNHGSAERELVPCASSIVSRDTQTRVRLALDAACGKEGSWTLDGLFSTKEESTGPVFCDSPQITALQVAEAESDRNIVTELRELLHMKEAGALTEDEFEAAKQMVLNQRSRSMAPLHYNNLLDQGTSSFQAKRRVWSQVDSLIKEVIHVENGNQRKAYKPRSPRALGLPTRGHLLWDGMSDTSAALLQEMNEQMAVSSGCDETKESPKLLQSVSNDPSSLHEQPSPADGNSEGTTNLPPSNPLPPPPATPSPPMQASKKPSVVSKIILGFTDRLMAADKGSVEAVDPAVAVSRHSSNSLLYSPALGLDLDVSDSGLVRIKNIVADSVVARDGRVREGDILLNFNGAELGNLSTQGIEQMIRVMPNSVNAMHLMDGATYDQLGSAPSLMQSVDLGKHYFVCVVCDKDYCKREDQPRSLAQNPTSLANTFQGLFSFTDMFKFKQGLASKQDSSSVSRQTHHRVSPHVSLFPQQQRRARNSADMQRPGRVASWAQSEVLSSVTSTKEIEEMIERAGRAARTRYRHSIKKKDKLANTVAEQVRGKALRKAQVPAIKRAA